MSDFRNDDKYKLITRLLDCMSERDGIERVEFANPHDEIGGYINIKFRASQKETV